MEELGEAGLDLLGFGPGSGEPEEVIVGVAAVAEPPEAGIVKVPAGQAALLLAKLARRGAVTALAGAAYRDRSPCGTPGL